MLGHILIIIQTLISHCLFTGGTVWENLFEIGQNLNNKLFIFNLWLYCHRYIKQDYYFSLYFFNIFFSKKSHSVYDGPLPESISLSRVARCFCAVVWSFFILFCSFVHSSSLALVARKGHEPLFIHPFLASTRKWALVIHAHHYEFVVIFTVKSYHQLKELRWSI